MRTSLNVLGWLLFFSAGLFLGGYIAPRVDAGASLTDARTYGEQQAERVELLRMLLKSVSFNLSRQELYDRVGGKITSGRIVNEDQKTFSIDAVSFVFDNNKVSDVTVLH